MSLPDPGSVRSRFGSAGANAQRMVSMGVPVFSAKLSEDGNPERRDQRWQGWQRTRPDEELVDAWQPGDAMCAVTGVVYDVIDVDPRNGGLDSFTKLSDDLGEDGPEVYWEVKTPSGGFHMYIAALGIGSHNGFMPGIDLKGGKTDKTGRGFVFLPPTQRKGGGYKPMRPLLELGDGQPCEALAAYIEEALEAKSSGASDAGQGRQDSDELRREVLAAGPGEQRTALLRYVHELERRGMERPEITLLLRALMGEMHNHDTKNPWYPARGGDQDRWIRTLFHRKGTVIPDASPEELEGMQEPVRAGLVRPLSSLRRDPIVWLWKRYLAERTLTVMDGEKGKGKTFVAFDVAARLSTGRPLPGEDYTDGEPCNIIIFGEEDNEGVLAARAEAAGMDMDRVFIRSTPKLKRGKSVMGEEFALPDGEFNIGRAIRAANARLAIFDPITDFLAEDIQTHNDASVRRALRPLADVLFRTGCAGWAFRHMNKAVGLDARMRGSGSTAFQNRARVHLAVGSMPDTYSGPGRYGVSMLDSNITRRADGVLVYDILDSDILMDDGDTYAGRVEWHGYVEGVSANDLLAGEQRKKGRPAVQHDMVRVALEEMFRNKPEWPATKAMTELREAYDCEAGDKVVQDVRRGLGIRAMRKPRRGQAGGTDYWVWVLGDQAEKSKVQD